MTAYEIGYTGVMRNRATRDAPRSTGTRTDDAIYFTPVAALLAGEPAAGVAAAAATCSSLIPTARCCRRRFTYVNLGKVKDKGIELGVDAAVNRYVNVFTNYSYQWEPGVEGFPTRRHQRHQLARRTTASTPASTSATSAISATCRSTTPTRRTGRTCSTRGSPARPTPTRWSTAASACAGSARRVVDQHQGHQPRQPGSDAAHLRRRHEAAGRRRGAVHVLNDARRSACMATPGDLLVLRDLRAQVRRPWPCAAPPTDRPTASSRVGEVVRS